MTDISTAQPSSSMRLPTIFGTAGVLIGATIAALVLMFGHHGVSGIRSMLLPSPMQAALIACGKLAHPSFVLESDGSVLFAAFFTRGDGRGHGHDADFDDVVCILDELEAPAGIYDRILATRPSDGVQTMQWREFSAEWSHAHHIGATLTITER